MFKKIEGGTLEKISNNNGYEYDCWVPPFGYGLNRHTGEIEKTDVIKRSDNKKDQYWERTTYPIPIKEWIARRKEEIRKQEFDTNHYDPVLMKFEQQEWGRRLRGVWFWNKGEKTYITGLHYLYINWWKFQGEYMNYRKTDRKYFYVVDYCIEDPDCLGLVEFTKRRAGKTARSGIFLYEPTSRLPNQHAGIQSKTDPDAGGVFRKAVVMPWKSLPDFFRPIYDVSGGDTPDKEMRFSHSSVRGKKALQRTGNETSALDSYIDFKNRGLFGYDGEALHWYVSDESGKLKDVSILDRHGVVQFCSEVDGKFIGKHLYTTTVEEMEAGGAEFKKLVEQSDPRERDGLGRTKSGLYTYFLPASHSLDPDIYGDTNEDKAKTYFGERRASLRNNPRELASFIRKNPETVEEAFWVDGNKCIFNNTLGLNERRSFLSWSQDKFTERGNLEWVDGVRFGKVKWVKNPHGRWEILKGFNPPDGILNNIIKGGNSFRPKNDGIFASAVDPFSHNTTEDTNRASAGASLVKLKFCPWEPLSPFTHGYVCKYRARPGTVYELFEDMIKQSFYFGCSILPETNKPQILDYFRDHGCWSFLMHLPGYKEPGIPSTAENKQTAAYFVEELIENHLDTIYFMEVIGDWLELDLKQTTKFDLGMASLWVEMAANNKRFAYQEKPKVIDLKKVFRSYKINAS